MENSKKKEESKLVEIKSLSLGKDSNFIEFDNPGTGTLIMKYNTDHSFYKNVLVDASLECHTAVSKLMFALGRSLYNMPETDEADSFIDELMRSMSDYAEKLYAER